MRIRCDVGHYHPPHCKDSASLFYKNYDEYFARCSYHVHAYHAQGPNFVEISKQEYVVAKVMDQ